MKKSMLILFVCLTLVLTACGSNAPANNAANDSGDKESAAATPEKVDDEGAKKLSFWYIDSGKRGEIIQDAVKQFMADHPGVEVEAIQIPNDAYKTKLSVAMGGNNPPDVFHSWGGGWLKQFVSADQVLELTDKIDKEAFLPAGIGPATYDGKIYGAPLAMSIVPMYYNKEIFAKYNLQPPQTYAEFLNIVDVLKKNDVIPISMANKSKWPAAFYLMYLAERNAGPEIFDEAFGRSGRTFADEGYVKAGEMIQDLVNRGAFNPGFNGLDYDTGQSRQLLYTGKAAMEMQTSSYINNIRKEAPEFEEKVGIFPFPAIEGGKGKITNLVGGVSPVFSVAANTKYPDLAVELVKALTTKEVAQKNADEASTISAVKGVNYTDKFAVQLNEMLNNAEFMQTFYDQTLPPELAELHKDTTQALFGLAITPKEAADQMETKAQEVLK